MKNTSNTKREAYRIVIVDDHPLMREGIANLLRTQSDFSIGGEAGETEEALELLRREHADIVLVDLTLRRGSSGFELIEEMARNMQDVPALVLSMHDENLYAKRSIEAGARGYVMKTEPPETLIRAIRDVLAGKIYLSENLRDRLVSDLAPGKKEAKQPFNVLSEREKQVFGMIGEGKTSREIAATLSVSPKTVEAHREHIKKKLGLANSPQLIRHAVEYVQAVKAV